MRGKQKGIVRISFKYSRGYDLKMVSSAFVIVALKDHSTVKCN